MKKKRDSEKPAKPAQVVDEGPKRKREISLTPPPEIPLDCYILPKLPPIPVIPPSSIINLDDDEASEPELDPELASIAAKITSSSTSTPLSPGYSASESGSSQKPRLSSDDDIIYGTPSSQPTGSKAPAPASAPAPAPAPAQALSSTPPRPAPVMETVDILLRMQRHPLLVVPPEHEVLMKEFEKPIQVTVRADESFRRMMEWYCAMKKSRSTLVFTFLGSRLMASSTPHSLDFPSKVVLDIYEQSAYDYIKQQETLEQSRSLAAMERYAKDAAHIGAMQTGGQGRRQQQQQQQPSRNNDYDDGGDEDPKAGDGATQESDPYLFIKLRGQNTSDLKIKVKPTTTIFAILSHYRNVNKIPFDTPVKLEFDDEVIDPSKTIGDTDVEDDDMLIVRVG
ncbi:ubiquitin-2 like Rad60 SUMO-like-domain-containing protein [Mortierella sp. GBAus27b]|nr:ubiquitin-2 like Rad60 SUMO-like-domain-containing protein [Mortierella sp. GBAus27b]